MQLPPLVVHHPARGMGRSSLGVGRGSAQSVSAYGVPTSDWESAKKKFFQCGGLSGSEQIAAFLSALSHADMLPHNVKHWLATLCEEEGAHLIKILDVLKGAGAATGSALLSSKGKPSSLSARKFASFRANREPQGSLPARDGEGARVTPRGSFRLTPRRMSQGVTPVEEPLGGGDPVVVDVQAVVASIGPARLLFDFSNVSVLEQTIASVLSHRAICALPPSPSLQALQAVANGKPTYDPVRDTGAMTLEQLALLLSFVAAPQIAERGGGTGDHRQRDSGNEEATASFMALLQQDDQGNAPEATSFSAAAGLRLEALLDELGMPAKQIMEMMAGGGGGVRDHALEVDDVNAPLLAALGGGDFRVGLDQLMLSGDADDGETGEDDVLARLTPPRRQSAVLRHSESIKSRSRRASSVTDPCAGSRASDFRSSSTLPLPQHPAVSFHSGGPGNNPTITPRRTPRLEMSFSGSDSLSIRHEEPVQVLSSRKATEPLPAPPTPHQVEVLVPVACVAGPAAVASIATQTDVRSFTLLWLGPKTRDAGTSSRPTGDVGRVVSLQLLKAAQRKRANPKAPGDSYEELCKLPVEELERRYQASLKEKKKTKSQRKTPLAIVQ